MASCMRLLDALLLPEFRDSPQLIADMNDNVQMVSQPLTVGANMVAVNFHTSQSGKDMYLCIASLHVVVNPALVTAQIWTIQLSKLSRMTHHGRNIVCLYGFV